MGRHSTPGPARADAAQPQPEPQPRPVVDVLFVCTANLCRSPVAERLARAQPTGSGLAVGRAGVHAQPGTAMDDEAAAALNTTTLDPAVDSTAGSPRERPAAVVSRAVALRGPLAPERPGDDDVGDPYRQGADAMRATVTEIDAWLRPLTALLVK